MTVKSYAKEKRPELLAPAGGMESLTAAVQNGCDAVYLGGKAFGARASADNFDRAGLQEALRYAHLYGVRVYVTVNTLYKDGELSALLAFITDLYTDGVDGLILQDLGAARMVRQVFPDLEIHASTQMTVHNLSGAQYLAEMGFTRVVLARELDLGEIQAIVSAAPIEVETFIHGALCICYSGQCLMSSLIGGRSGNRGRCAQPCRLPYQLVNRGTHDSAAAMPEPRYLLSPKDINTLEILPRLINSGISSFKMEGRLKRPEYTASVTRIYRKYLDLALEDPAHYQVEPGDWEELAQIFNRGGFQSGYYQGKTGRRMMSFERPKNWGIPVGEVISYDRKGCICKVRLSGDLAEGDGVEVWTDETEHPGTLVHILRQSGNIVTFSIRGAIRRGDPVYRTSRKSLLDELTASFGEFRRKIDLFGTIRLHPGEAIVLHLWDQYGNDVEVRSGEAAERAQKQPLTREKIIEQLSRMGNVPFHLREICVEMEEEVFLPVSRLNALRREAVELLTRNRLRRFAANRPVREANPAEILTVAKAKRVEKEIGGGGTRPEPHLALYLQGEGFRAERFIELGVRRLYMNLHTLHPERVAALKALGGEDQQVLAVLPRIARNRQMEEVREQLLRLLDSRIDGFLVGNLGEVGLLKEWGLFTPGSAPSFELVADFPLNIFNRLSLAHWAEEGLTGAVLSPELTLREMEELVQWTALGKEVIVSGHLPSMVSEYCPVGAVEGGMTGEGTCSRPGGHSYGLLDRMGHVFPVLTDCRNCRSVILNPQPLFLLEQLESILRVGFSTLRMDLTIESEADGLAVVEAYRERMRHPDQPLTETMRALVEAMRKRGFTKGHFYRGVE